MVEEARLLKQHPFHFAVSLVAGKMMFSVRLQACREKSTSEGRRRVTCLGGCIIGYETFHFTNPT